eukprot:COSAG01_NODE_1301_length_10829_cov_20.185182_5_plen_52_part_00
MHATAGACSHWLAASYWLVLVAVVALTPRTDRPMDSLWEVKKCAPVFPKFY